ncbi:hypothetical protein KA529_00100 [Candidatus Saccharibacteria bacterium]|nr:hypothetical protein [Candidatus Saccharibacteria bacterium]
MNRVALDIRTQDYSRIGRYVRELSARLEKDHPITLKRLQKFWPSFK